jgi:hypothetical protein
MLPRFDGSRGSDVMNLSIRFVAAIALAAGISAPAFAQPQSQPVTTEWFVGTWSDRPDCGQRVHFLGDGRFVTPAGGEGRWRLERNVIILTNPSREQRLPMERLDQNRARATESGVISYRCEGRSQ